MGIRIRKRKHDKFLVLELSGNMRGSDTLKVSRKLDAIAKKPSERVVADLSGIDTIDSSWLGAFVYSWKLFQEYDKELLFIIPPGPVLEAFTIANLNQTFKIVSSLEALLEDSSRPGLRAESVRERP